MTDPDLEQRLTEFWHQAEWALLPRNGWLKGRYGEIYVRAHRTRRSDPRDRLDIANIQIEPKYQHRGIFKSFLAHAETLTKHITIENIFNPDLTNYFRTMPEKWEERALHDIASFHKRPNYKE